MSPLYKFLTLVGAFALAVASCATSTPPTTSAPVSTSMSTPTPTITPVPVPTSPTDPLPPASVMTLPGRPNDFMFQDRDLACNDILVFDGVKAFENGRDDQPILWTFGVNFDLRSTDGSPVGCFKLYERGNSSYDPVGSFLADVCTITGTVDIASTRGYATFDGHGYVECSINLSQWVSQTVASDLYPDRAESLSGFYEEGTPSRPRPDHKYDNFAMVAHARLPKDIDAKALSESKVLPLLAYESSGVVSPTLSLQLDPSDIVHLGSCSIKLGEDETYSYWWYDLRALVEPNQRYASQEQGAPSETDCGTGPDSSPLVFSIQAATLYIGYDPTTGGIFQGTMDGILIDPTDSKPPAKAPSVTADDKTPTPPPDS